MHNNLQWSLEKYLCCTLLLAHFFLANGRAVLIRFCSIPHGLPWWCNPVYITIKPEWSPVLCDTGPRRHWRLLCRHTNITDVLNTQRPNIAVFIFINTSSISSCITCGITDRNLSPDYKRKKRVWTVSFEIGETQYLIFTLWFKKWRKKGHLEGK